MREQVPRERQNHLTQSVWQRGEFLACMAADMFSSWDFGLPQAAMSSAEWVRYILAGLFLQ
jgi:hypothetical protein